jgi:hypothetical protein
MLAILFLLTLFVVCAVSPWLGVDTSDSRRENARPSSGWFPALPSR